MENNEAAPARFQVREQSDGGYVVFDTIRNRIWSKTYVRKGWAIREAVNLVETYKNFKYTDWGN